MRSCPSDPRHRSAIAVTVMSTLLLAGCSGGDAVGTNTTATTTTPAASTTGTTPTATKSSPSVTAAASGPSGQTPAASQSSSHSSDLDAGGIAAALRKQAAGITTDGAAVLDVHDQVGAGRTITVSRAQLQHGSAFVAIYDVDLTLLGTSRVGTGSEPVVLTLSSPLTGTQELLAVLYRDNGDGRARPSSDRLVCDSSGNAKFTDFRYVLGTS